MSIFEISMCCIVIVGFIVFLAFVARFVKQEARFNEQIIDIRNANYEAVSNLNCSVHRLFLAINDLNLQLIKVRDLDPNDIDNYREAGESDDT